LFLSFASRKNDSCESFLWMIEHFPEKRLCP
jgi:hypothetical protein